MWHQGIWTWTASITILVKGDHTFLTKRERHREEQEEEEEKDKKKKEEEEKQKKKEEEVCLPHSYYSKSCSCRVCI